MFTSVSDEWGETVISGLLPDENVAGMDNAAKSFSRNTCQKESGFL
jgi:hypothetical protein